MILSYAILDMQNHNEWNSLWVIDQDECEFILPISKCKNKQTQITHKQMLEIANPKCFQKLKTDWKLG